MIDLASDKRETAGLIVEQLMPLLPAIVGAHSHPEGLHTQLLLDIQRGMTPIDTHDIKEQVADLVVERLNSRLSLREQNYASETVAENFSQRLLPLLEPSLANLRDSIREELAKFDALISGEGQSVKTTGADILHATAQNNRCLQTIGDSVNAVSKSHDDLRDTLRRVHTSTNDILSSVQSSGTHVERLVALHQDMLDRLMSLPDTFIAATSILQNVQNEITRTNGLTETGVAEQKAIAADLQTQLTQLQQANKELQLEKATQQGKLSLFEIDCGGHKERVAELERITQEHEATIASLKSTKTDLEKEIIITSQKMEYLLASADAESEHFKRLKSTNEALHDTQRTHLAKVTSHLISFGLVNTYNIAQVDSLEEHIKTLTMKLDAATENSERWQQEHSRLLSQQQHWDDLRRTADQVENLAALIGKADNEELQELRRIRDHNRVLESEHAALLKRYKDQEGKLANFERVTFTARQNLAGANQRASDWEKRAKEHESNADGYRTKWQKGEDLLVQQSAELASLQLRLEQRDAEEQAAQVSSKSLFFLYPKKGAHMPCRLKRPGRLNRANHSNFNYKACKTSSRQPMRNCASLHLRAPILVQAQRMDANHIPFALMIQEACIVAEVTHRRRI